MREKCGLQEAGCHVTTAWTYKLLPPPAPRLQAHDFVCLFQRNSCPPPPPPLSPLLPLRAKVQLWQTGWTAVPGWPTARCASPSLANPTLPSLHPQVQLMADWLDGCVASAWLDHACKHMSFFICSDVALPPPPSPSAPSLLIPIGSTDGRLAGRLCRQCLAGPCGRARGVQPGSAGTLTQRGPRQCGARVGGLEGVPNVAEQGSK